MFNLGHIFSLTVLQLQIDVQMVTMGRITQPVSSLSSICIVFCPVIQELKQAGSLKSGISQLACVQHRCLLYEKLMHKLLLKFQFKFDHRTQVNDQHASRPYVLMIFRQVCYLCSPYSETILSGIFFTSLIILYPYLISNLVTYFKILTNL
jgi:hypothetical protein